MKFIKTIFFLLFIYFFSNILVFAGMDKPWQDTDRFSDSSYQIDHILYVIIFFYALSRWPAEIMLLVGSVLVGIIVSSFLGEPIGWLSAILLALYGYSNLIK